MSRKRRNLTDEEQSLWNRVAQKVKPIPKEKKRITPEPSSPYRPLRKKPAFSLPPEETSSIKATHYIQRVRKVEIEARLDLHGLTLEQARLKLAKFLISCQERHYLWILIITGKGKPNLDADQSHDEPRKKTLRDQVPLWLEEPILRSVVSAYTTAKPQDGGSGALYVRLKRWS